MKSAINNCNHQCDPPFDYSKVTENIYLGTHPCCLDVFRDELQAKGVTATISLEGEELEVPRGLDCLLWLPVLDTFAPSLDQLRLGIRTIDELIRMERKVYVHCRYGVGCGPTLIAAHLVKHGMSIEESIAYVKKKRPLSNPGAAQIDRLEEYRICVLEKALEYAKEPHIKSLREKMKESKGPVT